MGLESMKLSSNRISTFLYVIHFFRSLRKVLTAISITWADFEKKTGGKKWYLRLGTFVGSRSALVRKGKSASCFRHDVRRIPQYSVFNFFLLLPSESNLSLVVGKPTLCNRNMSRFPECPQPKFLCPGTSICLPESWVCNNSTDCPAGEDEKNCEGKSWILPLSGWSVFLSELFAKILPDTHCVNFEFPASWVIHCCQACG